MARTPLPNSECNAAVFVRSADKPSDNVKRKKVFLAQLGFRRIEYLPSRSLQSASGMCEN